MSSTDTTEARSRAAEASWRNTADRSARTASARAAFDQKFETDDERRAHFRRLAEKSAESRRRAKADPSVRAEALADRIRLEVDKFPPLTAEQRERLAALLRPGAAS